MHNALCDVYGMDVPIFAFSHSPAVVLAVTKAGGFGVLGAAGLEPEELDRALKKISDARQRIERDAGQGGEGGKQLINYFVGQSVGMFKDILPAAEVFRALSEECDAVLKRMGQLVSG